MTVTVGCVFSGKKINLNTTCLCLCGVFSCQDTTVCRTLTLISKAIQNLGNMAQALSMESKDETWTRGEQRPRVSGVNSAAVFVISLSFSLTESFQLILMHLSRTLTVPMSLSLSLSLSLTHTHTHTHARVHTHTRTHGRTHTHTLSPNHLYGTTLWQSPLLHPLFHFHLLLHR